MEKGMQLKQENGKSISVPTKGFIDVLQMAQGLPSFRTVEGIKYSISPVSNAFSVINILLIYFCYIFLFVSKKYIYTFT